MHQHTMRKFYFDKTTKRFEVRYQLRALLALHGVYSTVMDYNATIKKYNV